MQHMLALQRPAACDFLYADNDLVCNVALQGPACHPPLSYTHCYNILLLSFPSHVVFLFCSFIACFLTCCHSVAYLRCAASLAVVASLAVAVQVRNCRLGMLAALGFAVQAWVTGKGPIQNAIDHLRDPFGQNGESMGRHLFMPSPKLLC